MIVNCPVCGKLTVIHWPEHWVYRRGETFYCSYQCMDVDSVRDMKLMNMVLRRRIDLKQVKEKDMKNHKLTLEQKKRAMEMVSEGKDPIQFLKECGAKNPYAALDYIKKTLGKKEVPEKAPVVYPVAKETVETPEGGWIPAREVYTEEKKPEPEQAELEAPDQEEAEMVDTNGFSIQQVNGQKSGIKYTYIEKRNELSVTFNNSNSSIVMSPFDWEEFSKEVVRAMVLMGV
jgi:hypothetical protein